VIVQMRWAELLPMNITSEVVQYPHEAGIAETECVGAPHQVAGQISVLPNRRPQSWYPPSHPDSDEVPIGQ
jgi:hypothetical protein